MDASQLADVITRAQQRDPEAFDLLVETYSARLYGYFYRLTGCRHDAEDLLQEVFIRLVRMIGAYEHDGRFDGWLFRIATNLVRDRVRRTRKAKSLGLEGQQHAVGDDLDPVVARADPDATQPDEALDRIEQIDRLQWAIQQLPEPEREVVLMRHFSGMAFRDIADVMGTPLGTALARAHRGLARLRDLMDVEDAVREVQGDK